MQNHITAAYAPIPGLTQADLAATRAALIPAAWAMTSEGLFAEIAHPDETGAAVAKCNECDTYVRFAILAAPIDGQHVVVDEQSIGAEVSPHYVMCADCVTAERNAAADYYGELR